MKNNYLIYRLNIFSFSSRLLCQELILSAKGRRGKKAGGQEVQQEKKAVTHGKDREKTCSSQQCVTERVVVENNYLSSKQIDAWSAEMKSCQASGGDCDGIIRKYEELSTSQQQQLISDCAANPATCQQKYGDVLADSMAVKHALDKSLGQDIPAKMAYDLTATWMHQIQADGVISTNKVSEALQKEYGLDAIQADIVRVRRQRRLGGLVRLGKAVHYLQLQLHLLRQRMV